VTPTIVEDYLTAQLRLYQGLWGAVEHKTGLRNAENSKTTTRSRNFQNKSVFYLEQKS
jgi:hypothetical protein